ncbi:RNA ligase family protein [Dictyobacter arantiisoli]|uniref:DNA ligase III n=1 Tax=Dictyobacter arantiisoli TaxID=2014874 RepID=A0A5A5THZ9_9CHLR|nr:RNA ligase family protein [Dictyobacter arantiisoli]GCF10683.1 DNA ligase III [Dictyobacter arantiisoli]
MSMLYKYPRTPHVEGSGIQRGDEDLRMLPLRELPGHYVVVEEKVDGANSALSFTEDGQLLLQSRGHYLSGGPREVQFQLLKSWAHSHSAAFWDVLMDRYILYGEWLYAKHTVFYTALPHYFLEFDIYDKQTGTFLSTAKRRALLAQLPFVCSVRVLFEGQLQSTQQLLALLTRSPYIEYNHLEQLRELCTKKHLNSEQALKETDPSTLMEGLYIKIETSESVQERWKYVRAGFQQAMQESESHWMNRPIIPNLLSKTASLF